MTNFNGYAVLSALVMVISSTAILAAPIRYECDTGAGRYSIITVPKGLADRNVAVDISAIKLLTDTNWYPTANVSIVSSDKHHAFGMSLRRPRPGNTVELAALRKDNGVPQEKPLYNVALNQPMHVRLSNKNGRSVVTVGVKDFDMGPAIDASSVQVSCSGGDFLMDNLDWDAPN